MKKPSYKGRQALFRLLENNLFIHASRTSLMLILTSILSGCCCLWYVDVNEPEVYSNQKRKAKTNTVQDPASKKKDSIEKN